MKYFYPIHFDGGNRGCEAIAKSTAIIVGEDVGNQFGYCRDIKLDTQLGLDKFLTLVPCGVDSYLADRFLAALNRLFHTHRTMIWRTNYPYRKLLRLISPGDRVLFTGGDMLCYGDNEIVTLNNWLSQHGVETILWGCSMGPENQTTEKLKTLFKFSMIYTRESLTFSYMKSLGLKNVCLLPDPAFILSPESCSLPDCFAKGRVIGINISNYVMGGITLNGRFANEVLGLIEHILSDTDLHILLIPHVTWVFKTQSQDDREIARLIADHFGNNERIDILDIDSLNYCQIRNVISKCWAFIGARTHAVISSYSTCVPAIALGYSIKSRGIAKDLGLDEALVVNSKNFKEGELLKSFAYLMNNHDAIHNHLLSVIPEYSQRPYQIREKLSFT